MVWGMYCRGVFFMVFGPQNDENVLKGKFSDTSGVCFFGLRKQHLKIRKICKKRKRIRLVSYNISI